MPKYYYSAWHWRINWRWSPQWLGQVYQTLELGFASISRIDWKEYIDEYWLCKYRNKLCEMLNDMAWEYFKKNYRRSQ